MTHEILFLVIGAVLGFIITLFGDWIKSLIKYKRFSNRYSKYEGIYLAFKKYASDENDVSSAFKYFELIREKNVFKIINGISVLGNEDFEGQISMSESIYSYGRGYYQHKKDKQNIARFGFLEIQLTEKELLAHETIYNDEGGQNSNGYRWVKQDSAKKDEIYNACRKIQQQKSSGR